MSSAEIAPNFYDCEDLDKHVSEELWYAIAGQGVMVPQAGELVVYFPQGHLQQSGGVSKHLKDVPSQITCRLLNLELKSKKDFVYALLLLEPEPNHDFEVINNRGLLPPMPRHPVSYFCKKLGVADTVAHAWLSIPRKHAEKCLPQLDMTQMAPTQELVVKDLSGKEWCFQHRLVRQMRHLLQITDFATSKNLVAGDVIVILRGQDGELRVGVRRSMRQLRNVPAPEMLNDKGSEKGVSILESISHAVTTRSKFTVLYKPRTGTEQFVVSFNQYVDSIKSCHTGTRFRMISSREAATEDRVSGIISGIEDFDLA
ncbi:auxin response factor 2A-like isoform X4 [Panicum virgatum]|uniref:auxin response factor 2A-like isoform X4 n=1 Tax=Panicum virgatum TaxID=38727 RepID=UPI0019D5B663|nr:auxin response factor 2A-like isoform X4 [Panicum virgatum]